MKEILKKYVNGQCTADEFKKAVIVLAGLARRGTLHDFMYKHWKDYTGEEVERNPERFNQLLNQIHHEINIVEEQTSLGQKFYRTFSKVAAVLVLPLLAALTLFVYQNHGGEQDALTKMTSPAGGQSHVELPDGSQVWLNAESELHFPSNFDGKERREVKLIGEGYFEVATDKKRPFILSAGEEFDVRVTGTTFNLSVYENEPEVSLALVEGGVRIEKGKDDEHKVLTEMKDCEVARFEKNSEQLSVRGEENMKPYLAWKNGMFVFENEPFESILRTMERKYNVKYKIEDPGLLEYRMTATFLDATLEEFLKKITKTSPVEYKIHRPKDDEENEVHQKRVVVLTRK